MRDYYRAWARTLLRDGRYLPGVYVHAHNAQVVYDDLKAEFAAAGVNEEPRVWVASGRGFDESKAPQDVGFAFAGVWQGLIDVGARRGGHQAAGGRERLQLDLSVRALRARSRLTV